MAQPDRTYLLFDIDGTLMEAEGAGRAALERAYAEATGVRGVMDGVAFFGRTDRWIFGEVERRSGVAIERESFLPRYLAILEEELAARRPRALSGARALLDRLAARDDVVLGLCSGNMRRGAYAKLRQVGLDGYFANGGFGDDHEDRARVLRDAVLAVGWTEGARLAHIGDTEHDVHAAHAAAAIAVGVASGVRTLDGLRDAGADVLLRDLNGGGTFEALLGA